MTFLGLVGTVSFGLAIVLSAFQSPFSEQDRLLRLREAQLSVARAKSDYERHQKLWDEGLLSAATLESMKTQLLQAQVNYQRIFLGLFSDLPNISLVRALKSREPDGGTSVVIEIRNSSGVNLDYRQLGITEDEAPLPDQMSLRELRNVVFSLKDENDAAMSKPYEVQLEKLKVGESKSIRFSLLKDTDTVVLLSGATSKAATQGRVKTGQ